MVLKKHLSKKDAIGLLDIAESCLSCSAPEQLQQLLRMLRNQISFDCAVCGCPEIRSVLFDAKIAPAYISLDYPQEILDIVLSQGYHLQDKVLQEFFETFELLNWQDVLRKYPEGNPVDEMAIDFGLPDGFTYGLRDADMTKATTFFLAGERIENTPRTRAILRYAIPHMSEALKRVLDRATPSHASPLTPREREVLKWLKEGKSSWDISKILGLSERAVNFHAANIIQKLHAMNRTHAVAIAMRKKIIEI